MIMTSWIVFAVVARLFMAMGKSVDRHIAATFGHRRIISAMVLQNITAFISLVMIAVFHGIPHTIDSQTVLWINIGVVSYLCAHLPYLKALEKEDSGNVVPFYEITPIVLTLLSLVILHEHLVFPRDLIGLLLVVAGFLFMWDFKKNEIKKRVLLLMALSSVLMALYFFAMRIASAQYSPIDILWMIDSGFFMAGLVMLIAYPRTLGNVKLAITRSRGKIILWEFLAGILFRLVSLSIIMALSLAPSASLVAAFSALQPLFAASIAWLVLKDKVKIDWAERRTQVKLALVVIILLLAGLLSQVPHL